MKNSMSSVSQSYRIFRRTKIDAVMVWIASLIVALGIGLFAWKILDLIFPYDALTLLSLKKTPTEYDLMKWATGFVFFSMVNIILAMIWYRDSGRLIKTKYLEESNQKTLSMIFEVLFLSARIALAGYFFLLWVNYVPLMWFRRISKFMGDLGIEFWGAFFCLVLLDLICVYLIIREPWTKKVKREDRLWVFRLIIYIVISLPIYFLGLVNPFHDINGVIFISFCFLAAFTIFMIWIRSNNTELSS
jgi:hypothetical protein